MMELATILLCSLVTLLLFLVHRYYQNPPGFPPGPKGLFLLGYIPFIKPRTFIKFAELKKKYGCVVGLRIGTRRTVLLLSSDAIEEAFVKKADNFAGRMKSKFISDLIHDSGIVSVDGDLWQEHRRFALHILKDFGLGRNLSEQFIQEEAQRLNECLSARAGRPCEPMDSIRRAVSSVICSITLSEHPAYDDDEYTKVVLALQDNVRIPIHQIPTFAFPFINNFSFFMLRLPAVKIIIASQDVIHSFIRKKIEKHRASIDWDGEPRDLTDAYLQEQAKRQASGQPHTFSDWQLIRVVAELFAAGTDTTANSLNWFLVLVALHPAIQNRLHLEIDSAIGRSRQPTMKDKTVLNYLCATLDEVQRYASIVPNSVIHRNFKEDTIAGFRIPANSTIIPCLYSCHFDPDVWQEPEQFRPEHFLTDDGKEYKSRKELIPFSLGRRACLGEALAKMELFLFGAFLMQRFSVKLSQEKPINLDEILMGTDGIIRTIEGFQLILNIRE